VEEFLVEMSSACENTAEVFGRFFLLFIYFLIQSRSYMEFV